MGEPPKKKPVRGLFDDETEQHVPTKRALRAPINVPPLSSVSEIDRKRPASRSKHRPVPQDRPRTLVPEPTKAPSDLIAMELDDMIRGVRARWRRGTKVGILSSMAVLIGTLLPWTSDAGQLHRLGIFAGASLHVLIGALALFLSVRKPPKRGAARDAMRLILLGILSIVIGIFLLGYWIFQKQSGLSVQIHWGFYWTLASGMGIAYGGYARFCDPAITEHR